LFFISGIRVSLLLVFTDTGWMVWLHVWRRRGKDEKSSLTLLAALSPSPICRQLAFQKHHPLHCDPWGLNGESGDCRLRKRAEMEQRKSVIASVCTPSFVPPPNQGTIACNHWTQNRLSTKPHCRATANDRKNNDRQSYIFKSGHALYDGCFLL